MQPEVEAWFAARSSRASDWPLDRVLAAKASTTVSVVLPALDEAATVGGIVDAIATNLVRLARPLVDELVVVDSGSTDDTAAIARAAGARVVHLADVLPHVPVIAGKGEALWRSLASTSGDVVVFVDADLLSFDVSYITGLLGPLLSDPDVAFVKAAYDRPLAKGAVVHPSGGGRVTELVARPLLNVHWRALAGFVQPLAGEYAARRSLLERLPFPTGYGVELALLVDTEAEVGLDAMAQVDLGHRRHRNHDDLRLGRMATEIWHAAAARLGLDTAAVASAASVTQFERSDNDASGFAPTTHDVTVLERPPMAYLLDNERLIG
ncbi:MAG TPA: glucosyl-3-phosphoglycerate synthase [Actinomycetes bacterium]|nr:glucosyl-3-phosphoglycerate synthase [Actinomycetes bacterium]